MRNVQIFVSYDRIYALHELFYIYGTTDSLGLIMGYFCDTVCDVRPDIDT